MSARGTCLTLVLVTVATGGVFHVAAHVAPQVAGLVATALVPLWCKLDAADRKVVLPTWNFGLILFLMIVGLPVYFFRTMPFHDAVGRILKVIGLFVVLLIVAGVSSGLAARLLTPT